MNDDVASYEVIRPAAVLSEASARLILQGLAGDDVRAGGRWWTRIGTWRRYETPWAPGADAPGEALHVGTLSCVYDSPARYCVTVFRVSMTSYGLRQGWTTESLCDEAFRHAGLTLADCPRAALATPPPPFRALPQPGLARPQPGLRAGVPVQQGLSGPGPVPAPQPLTHGGRAR